MKRVSLIYLLLVCFVLGVSISAFSQESTPKVYPDDPIFLKNQFIQKTFKPDHITKKPGHYTRTDWDEAIDSTWGMGLPRSTKIYILNTFWNKIDQEFACFVNHPDYYAGWWDSLKTVYTDEINSGDPIYGVSRGRFAAIMFHLSLALKELHTFAIDYLVTSYTALEPGVPLILCGGHGENGHFGAGLTPLSDSSLVVYRSVQDHPLGLVPGDIVLGYDGIPWKDLYQELLDAQLPIAAGWNWGSSESAYSHLWLMGAGMNWHLFDTLDVVKYSTGDTLHLSVEPLIGQDMQLWCTEQIDIPGVQIPDYNSGERATFGIIEGTQIGYIYVMEWEGNVESELYNAVNTLMNDYETTGLIIDFRTHYGGWPAYANKSLELLFNTKEPLYGWDQRCSSNDHLALCPEDFFAFHYIYGSAKSYYDKPIAVLTGPGAASGGDYISLAMKFHPMTRVFGKPTVGAFNYRFTLNLGNSDWLGRYDPANMYLLNDPGNHLTRWELGIDEEVWFSPDDVAQGYDTVVESAKVWINSQQGIQPDILCDPMAIDVSLEYGEVTTRDLTITNNGTRQLFYSLTPEIDTSLTQISSIPPTITGHGGYDNFGYTWIDSDQPHGPSFNWVDISGVGIPLSLGDNAYAGPIVIGFEFPFYENSFSQLYISSNGLITFGNGTTVNSNDNIPVTDLPNNLIAPWWDDLRPNVSGNIYYYYDNANERFIVSFLGVRKYDYVNGVSGYATFQVILNSNGQIELNYLRAYLPRNAFDMYSATIGIENSDGSDGLEIHYNAPYTIDNYSIVITTNWLAVSPYSSYIAPGENEFATVTFNAKHLEPGATYVGSIYLDSNDPEYPCINIPVTLVVEGYQYLPGDANMYNGAWPPTVIGGDVTYLVNYFRGQPCCPSCLSEGFFCAADINGDCQVIGGDVTRLVNYFRGSADILYCPDYEPAWPTPMDVPENPPPGWPNCE